MSSIEKIEERMKQIEDQLLHLEVILKDESDLVTPKVKVLYFDDPKELEDNINEFLEGVEGYLIDIKYTTTILTNSEEILHTAMIIYEQKKERLM